jgi:aspartate racemase
VEKELITEARNEKNILPFLINAARQLEKGGADFIVIPCNTVHIFIEEIRESVNIPVLSIIEETSNFLSKEKIKKVGVFATTATIQNKLFDENLKRHGIEMKIPNNSNQTKMGAIINRLVNNQQTRNDKNEFLKIIKETNARNVILACTDLQILEPKISEVKIFDTMDILAKASVREVLK